MRPSVQQISPKQVSPGKHSSVLVQSLVADSQRRPAGVSAQIWPLGQHIPLQHEALLQQTPPQITVP
jgi:hypothetical protein